MKKLLLKLLLLVLLPTLGLELWFRSQPASLDWYRQVQGRLREDEVNVFVVGSSRTAAAIDAEAATRVLRERGVRNARVYNLGAPYSTLIEHFLGLRNMAEAAPGALKG